MIIIISVLIIIFLTLALANLFLPEIYTYGLIIVGIFVMIIFYWLGGGSTEWGYTASKANSFLRLWPRYVNTYQDLRYYGSASYWWIIILGVIIGGIMILAGIVGFFI